MNIDNDLKRETKFQRRKVAGIERYLTQIDADVANLDVVIAMSEEQKLKIAEMRQGYEAKLKEEQSYLQWLEDDAPVDDEPDTGDAE